MVATLIQEGQEWLLKLALHKVQAADEVQTVDITGTPGGGNFKLAFEGDVTANIAYNADAAAVDAALEALDSIPAGGVVVTGSNPNFTVTFAGFLKATPVPLLVLDTNGLTGGSSPSVAIARTTTGAGGPPQYYYIGLSQSLRAVLGENATLASINEVAGTGYARVRVRADSTDWPAALVGGYWQAVSKNLPFTPTGSWSTARSMFLATTRNNTGKLLDVRDLPTEMTLTTGQDRGFNFTEMFATAA